METPGVLLLRDTADPGFCFTVNLCLGRRVRAAAQLEALCQQQSWALPSTNLGCMGRVGDLEVSPSEVPVSGKLWNSVNLSLSD